MVYLLLFTVYPEGQREPKQPGHVEQITQAASRLSFQVSMVPGCIPVKSSATRSTLGITVPTARLLFALSTTKHNDSRSSKID